MLASKIMSFTKRYQQIPPKKANPKIVLFDSIKVLQRQMGSFKIEKI